MIRIKKRKYENLDAVRIFKAAVESVSAPSFIGEHIKFENKKLTVAGDEYDLSKYNNIYLAGSGKASVPMAKAMSALFPGKFSSNLIISNTYASRFTRLKIMLGSHPYPTKKSFACGRAMHSFFSSMELRDFFIYLLSGGSSALMESSYGGLSYEDWSAMTEILQKAGLSIRELNILRRKLSMVKAGQLGRITNARGIVLVLSDVIDNDLETIGSGPFYGSEPDIEDIKKVLLRYELIDKLPKNILVELMKERPKQSAGTYPHYILASNKTALIGASRKARDLGYKVMIIDDKMKGEAVDYGAQISRIVRNYTGSRPVCLLFGGETVVNVRGTGSGGRNQEMALSSLIYLSGMEDISLLCGGTDGIDGPTSAAGAYFDGRILAKVRTSGLDASEYLRNNDSNGFFRKLKDGLIEFGPTGTNVGDLAIALLH